MGLIRCLTLFKCHTILNSQPAASSMQSSLTAISFALFILPYATKKKTRLLWSQNGSVRIVGTGTHVGIFVIIKFCLHATSNIPSMSTFLTIDQDWYLTIVAFRANEMNNKRPKVRYSEPLLVDIQDFPYWDHGFELQVYPCNHRSLRRLGGLLWEKRGGICLPWAALAA